MTSIVSVSPVTVPETCQGVRSGYKTILSRTFLKPLLRVLLLMPHTELATINPETPSPSMYEKISILNNSLSSNESIYLHFPLISLR